MIEENVLNKLEQIFKEVFVGKDIKVARELKAADVDEWDSLAHINIIVAIEKEFKITFSLEELDQQKNVGDTIDQILKKYE